MRPAAPPSAGAESAPSTDFEMHSRGFMDSNDLTLLERRARIRYEWTRARRALIGSAPLLVVMGIVSVIAYRPWAPLAFGLAAFAAGVMMLWYGQGPQRAVLPGIAAGLVPMLLALCAM